MILNNIEVKILASIELEDAYNKIYPQDFIYENVIYCIHNKVNNKNYIGQTKNFKNRFSTQLIGHFKCYNDYISGNHIRGKYLYKSWGKYGFKSFIVYIIDHSSTSDKLILDEKETYWIKILHTCVKDPEAWGYNLTWGADDYGHFGSPESISKGKKTKLEKYGTNEVFINSHTPEAKEKRKQTLIKKFGKTGGCLTEEALDKMLKTKIEKYGDIMGACNLPENREKASHTQSRTDFFKKANSILSNSNIFTLEDYFKTVIPSYSEYKYAKHHLYRIVEILPELILDSRWTSELEKIFGTSQENLKNNLDLLYEKRKDEIFKFSKSEEWRKTSTANQYISLIYKNSEIDENLTWDKYKNSVLSKYSAKDKAKRHINHLIDSIPDMKKSEKWNELLEKIFGSLTEKDKI